MSQDNVLNIIFADTFDYKDKSTEVRVDAIQFSSPSLIKEIYVIPDGTVVQAGFACDNDVFQGHTSPSQFTLQFYINAISISNPATFTPIGNLDYIAPRGFLRLTPSSRDATDTLLIKGLYQTLSLVILGAVSSDWSIVNVNETTSKPMLDVPRFPPPRIFAGNNIPPIFPPPPEGLMFPPPRISTSNSSNADSNVNSQNDTSWDEAAKLFLEGGNTGGEKAAEARIYELLSGNSKSSKGESPQQPLPTPSSAIQPPLGGVDLSDMTSMLVGSASSNEKPSNGKKLPADYDPLSDDDYEDIVSEEEAFDEDDIDAAEETNFVPLLSFDPLTNLDSVKEASLKYLKSEHLWRVKLVDVSQITNAMLNAFEENLTKLCAMENRNNNRWVIYLEAVEDKMVNSLAFVKTKDPDKYLEMCRQLVDHAMRALNWDLAVTQEPGYNVRQIKIGFIIVEVLANFDAPVLQLLLDADVVDVVFSLLNHELVVTPIKLFGFFALDSIASSVTGMDRLLSGSTYKQISALTDSPRIRIAHAAFLIAHKIHIFEVIRSLRMHTVKILPRLSSIEDYDLCDVKLTDVEDCLDSLLKEINEYMNASLQVPGQLKVLKASMPCIFRYFENDDLLDLLLAMMSSPAFTRENRLYGCIKDLFQWILSSSQGQKFLLSRPQTICSICQCLITHNENESDREIMEFGINIALHIHTLLGMDNLLEVLNYESKDDYSTSTKLLHCLQQLHNITQKGREVVGQVLVMSGHISKLVDIVLATAPPIAPSNEEVKTDEKVTTSPCCILATSILLRVAEHCQQLDDWGGPLLAVTERVEKGRLMEMSRWIEPLRELSCKIECIGPMVDYIKARLDDLNNHFLSDAPGLITTLRMMERLMGASADHSQTQTAIHLFSSSGFEIIMKLCDALTSYLWRQFQLNVHLTAYITLLCHGIAVPVVKIMHAVIEQVISAGHIEFRDMRIVRAVLPLHSILSSVSSQGVVHSSGAKFQTLVCRLLLLYTKSFTGPLAEDTEFSGWSNMLGAVLDHLQFSPNCYVSGLSLLSEMLPLPLPIYAPQPLSQQELDYIGRNRRQWGVHVLSQADNIRSMLNDMLQSNSSQLASVLRRISWQLADISPSLACLVIEEITQVVEQVLSEYKPPQDDARVLRLLLHLDHILSQPSGKSAFLHLLSTHNSAPLKTLQRLVSLLSADGRHEPVLRAQYCIVSIVQSLCDPSVTLLPFDSNDTQLHPQFLVCSLPDAAVCEDIISRLLTHAADYRQSMFTFEYAIKPVALLCAHDFGFSLVKKFLESSPNVVADMITRLAESPSDDRIGSVSSLLSWLHCLKGSDESDDFISTNRKQKMSSEEIAALLHPPNSVDAADLLTFILEKTDSWDGDKLKTTLKALLEDDNDSAISSEEIMDSDYKKLSLKEEFAQRAMFTVAMIEDERLSPSIWFSIPPDDVEDKELVKCNLLDLCKEVFPDFDLKAELKKGLICEKDLLKARKKLSKRGRRFDYLTSKGFKTKVTVRRPNYLAKEKGINLGPVRSDDIFRLRKQNTSRPPSMHVDDFTFLEETTIEAKHSPDSRRSKKLESSSPASTPPRSIPSSTIFSDFAKSGAARNLSQAASDDRGFYGASKAWTSSSSQRSNSRLSGT